MSPSSNFLLAGEKLLHAQAVRSLPNSQSTFDSLPSIINNRAVNEARIKSHGRRPSWKYDTSEIRQALKSGAYEVLPSDLYKDFKDWHDDCSIVNLQNIITGEKQKMLASKRGNIAHARKYKKILDNIEYALKNLVWDVPFGRNTRSTLLLLITLTYDHKRIGIQQTWAGLSRDITIFKVQLRRVFGDGVQVMRVPEGSTSGYPAPHLLVMLPRPVICFQYHGLWRVKNQAVVDLLKSKWEKKRGFLDIRAVIGGVVRNDDGKMVSPVYYLMKYLSKSIPMGKSSSESDGGSSEAPEQYPTALTTHAWQKLFRMHPMHISQGFKQRLNVRLDTIISISKQQESSSWLFIGVEYCKINDYIRVMTAFPPNNNTKSRFSVE